jgi:hypothetical protein
MIVFVAAVVPVAACAVAVYWQGRYQPKHRK